MLHIAPELEDDDIRVTPSGVTGEDLNLSPEARAIFPIAPEGKNQESLNIWKSLEQAESNAGEHIPVLFFKRNRSKTYVALEAHVFLNLLASFGGSDELHGKISATTKPIQDTEGVS